MRLRRRAVLTLAAAVPLLASTGCGYNRIQELDEQAAAYKQQIEVQLQRRSDLIPNLVNTVQGFAQQEATVLREVTQARAGLQQALQRPGGADISELAQADAAMNSALGRLNFVVEAYPELRSNENFLRLQDELAGTENRVAVARQDYNQAVQAYNTYIRRFPQVLTAKVIGADAREYFEVTDPGAREAPTVEFPGTKD
jgi:LemA protein